jgi:hypothetical protein
MLFTVLVISATTARAQSSFTTIEYNNKMQPALVLELPRSTEDVKGTIIQKLKQVGYKPETQGHLFWKKHTIDGFYVYNNVMLPSLTTQKVDMYFKVIQKNNEEKNSSTVYLLVSNGNENFTSPVSDEILWNNSMAFLNSFVERTAAYSLEQNITRQETALNDSQKKLGALRKDEKELTDKIKKYQDDLLSNKDSQVDQQLDIENQAKLLEDLKLKRKI